MLIWLEKITNNNSLLNIISSGNRNQFPIALYQSKPIVSVTSKLNSEIIEGQILNHLESGAILIFPYIYRVLLNVKKSNGKDCLIINLSLLNSQISNSIFRMEDHKYLKNLICTGEFMVPIDLSNALFSIPLHKESKTFLLIGIER